MIKKKKFIKDLKKAWHSEMFSAGNYRALAEREKHPEKRAILLRMAEAEEKHAERWRNRLQEMGVALKKNKDSIVEKIKRKIILKSSNADAARLLETGEGNADLLYERLIKNSELESDKKIFTDVQREENTHSKMLIDINKPLFTQHPQTRLDTLLGRERWHITAGGWIGQAIYGINDGLGAAFGVVSGIAGATSVNSDIILLSGLATAIASAMSMGGGAYLSSKSEREIYEAEIEREKREIDENPEEEKEEIELFYQLKGFTPEDAKKMATKLAEQPEQFLKTIAHEELGLSEKSFPDQWVSAFSAMISTFIGAIIPVLPFFFFSGLNGLIISFIVSTAAHFFIGAIKTLITGRSWVKSGLEMTFVGLITASATYLIGMLIAPVVG